MTRNSDVYNFILDYSVKNGLFPILRDIQHRFGMSATAARYHMNTLVKKGKVVKVSDKRYMVPELKIVRCDG